MRRCFKALTVFTALGGVALYLCGCPSTVRPRSPDHPTSISETGPIQMEVRLSSQTATDVELAVTLKNTGSNTVSVPFSEVPWATYGMTLVAVPANSFDPCVPLKQIIVIADSVYLPPHRIKKGESLSGTIDLSLEFLDLPKTLKHDDVIVFWSYYLGVEGVKQRLSGSLVIPKQPD